MYLTPKAMDELKNKNTSLARKIIANRNQQEAIAVREAADIADKEVEDITRYKNNQSKISIGNKKPKSKYVENNAYLLGNSSILAKESKDLKPLFSDRITYTLDK